MVARDFPFHYYQRRALVRIAGLVIGSSLSFFWRADALPAQVAPANPPVFVVHTIDGPLAAAPLAKLGEDWSMELGDGTRHALAGDQWLSLRRERVPLPPFPTRNSVRLTTGDRLLVEPDTPFRLEDERLFFRSDKGPEISVAVSFLSYLCLRVPEGLEDPDPFLDRLDQSKRPRDVFYLKGGDRLEGTLLLPARGPAYTMKLGNRSVDSLLDQIAILALNTELQARPKPRKTFAHVVTVGGARLQFSSLRLDTRRQTLAGKTLFGANLEVPLGDLAGLTIWQGQTVYLSDLTPERYEHTPFLGVKWPLVSDTTMAGSQLSAGGNYYDKGLAMHAQSQVTYALDHKYRWFEAMVGLEGGTGKQGHVKVSIALDGTREVFHKDLSGRGTFLPLRVDVRTAQTITLRVDFGDFGDVQGRVDWIEARLVREGKQAPPRK